MKNVTLLLVAVFMVSLMASCASPYKKRKRCRGNGSWYGNRNLGAIEQQKKQDKQMETYVVANTDDTDIKLN